MDRTNYPLLSLVSIVAITAVVAMFLSARASDGLPSVDDAVAVAGNAVFDIHLTGMVSAEETQVEPVRYTLPLDFNANSKLDRGDAEVLGLVIDRVQFCPRNTRCDVNEDGFVDIADLGALNAQILQQEAIQPTTTTRTQTSTRVQNTQNADPSLSMGAFGAIA
jgi:hypothetical protein